MLSAFLLLGTISCQQAASPQAVDGVIDLRGQNLERELAILAGQWQAFPGELLTPAQLEGRVPNQADFPSAWRDLAQDKSGKVWGYATFRLTVLVDTAALHELAIACSEHATAYTLWVNGQILQKNGKLGKTRAEEVPENIYRHNSIAITSPRVELVLQASSHYLDSRGHLFRFRLGSRERMETAYAWGITPYLIALGILLVFTVQYLVFLGALMKDRTYLLFGLFCCFWLISGICAPTEYVFATWWWPGISVQVLTIITFVGVTVSLLLLSLFYESLFPGRSLRVANRLFLPVVAGVVLVLVVGPYSWAYPVFGLMILGFVGLAILHCYSVAVAIKRRSKGAIAFTIGLALFLGATAHDVLIFWGVIDSVYILQLGGAAVAIAEAFALTQRWIATHRANTELLFQVQTKNAELSRLSRLKDDFLANTSHELRTPLHGILGLTQAVLVDTHSQLSSEVRRNLGHVASSARRLTRLVNDILDFSKIRHRDLSLRMGAVDLAVVVPGLLPHFQALVANKGLGLRCDVATNLPLVAADEDRFEQILFNLVGNAIKFTDGGEVSIVIQAVADGVEVAVTDTGIGIEPHLQGRIFEPFEQVEGEYRGGTGLGLSITRQLVELHGGTLGVDSVPGQGTTFRFRLAAASLGAVAVAATESGVLERSLMAPWSETENFATDPEILPGPGGRVVLAIDDEPVNLVILRSLLVAKGIAVVTASDGRRALELIEEHDPVLVLLDVMMPHLDGYEVCAHIRQRHSPSELPVLFLSARSRLEDVIHGFAAGGNDYVLKPFLGQELVARVDVQMRQREAFAALKENRNLKLELAEVVLERRQLEATKGRLLGLFDSLEEPLLVVDATWGIRLANRGMEQLLGVAAGSLLEQGWDAWVVDRHALGTAPTAGNLRVALRTAPGGSLEVQLRMAPLTVDDEALWVVVAEVEVVPAANRSLSRLVLQKLNHGEDRLLQLRGRMDSLTDDLRMDLPIGELQSTLTQIRELVVDRPDPEAKLHLACEILNDALELWIAHTGKSKADLAEESGLWAVQVDANGWRRPATLDKYLDLNKIPRLPKWKTIQKTVAFVAKAVAGHPRAQALETKAERLQAS